MCSYLRFVLSFVELNNDVIIEKKTGCVRTYVRVCVCVWTVLYSARFNYCMSSIVLCFISRLPALNFSFQLMTRVDHLKPLIFRQSSLYGPLVACDIIRPWIGSAQRLRFSSDSIWALKRASMTLAVALTGRPVFSINALLIMAALWNRACHYIFVLWSLLLSSFFFFPRLIWAVAFRM